MLKLFIFLSCFSFVLATENIFDSIVEGKGTAVSKSTESNNTGDLISLKIKKAPVKIYKNERFAISFEASVKDNSFDQIETEFSNHSNVEIINKDSNWANKKSEVYSNTFYFVASDMNHTLPQLTFRVFKNGSLLATKAISIPKFKFYDLGAKPPLFSGLICDELTVVNIKSKTYDQKNNITVIELRTKNGNLQDFHLKGVVDQGVESLKEDVTYDELSFYFVTPNFQKSLDFDYLKANDNVYKKIIIPINVVDDSVTTQTNLNPKDSTFYFYKIYFYIALTLGLIVLFMIKKYKWALYISVLPLYFLYDLTLNNDSAILKKSTNIYILPTFNSTVFKVLDEDTKVEIINSNDQFVKVVFQNRQIGWAKKDDIK